MEQGRTTSRDIVTQSLVRIATYEDRLNAVITVNPRALAEADALDRERRAGRIRGPLHGIPIALKDNIHTTDMPTTGGALAFARLVPPYEATLTKNLRDAGAIIIAKTVMTELANWVGERRCRPTTTRSPASGSIRTIRAAIRATRRSTAGRCCATGGSSSGIGTAASFWAANVGTETSGSILSPSNQNMLVGIKPTVGRISRYGVIPITADQDTPGPMARTVTDAAIMLGALEGASPDPNDAGDEDVHAAAGTRLHEVPEARGAEGRAHRHPARVLLRRARASPGERGCSGGLNDAQKKVMEDAIAALQRRARSSSIPPTSRASSTTDPAHNFAALGRCAAVEQMPRAATTTARSSSSTA